MGQVIGVVVERLTIADEISKFYKYVIDFYNNEDGIYPIASKEECISAVDEYLLSKPLSEIEFDSIDREAVRMILQPGYSIF